MSLPDRPEVFITVGDFEGIDGVVAVRNCDPEPGHVTLVVAPGSEGLADELMETGRVQWNFYVHEETAR